MCTHIDLMDGVTSARADLLSNHSSLKIQSGATSVTIFLDQVDYETARKAADVLALLGMRNAVVNLPVHVGHLLDRVSA